MTGKHKVAIILDHNFGIRLADLPACLPIWIVDSPANSSAARQHWEEHPKQDHLSGVTTFKAAPQASSEDVFAGQFSTIDLHHGPYSADPPYSEVEVFGLLPTDDVRTVLAEYGFEISQITSEGFVASRKNAPTPAHSKPIVSPAIVLAFWRAAGPDKWFEKDAAFDAEIQTRFLATYEAAADGQLAWDQDPEGALALLIVLDQFPRNMFRDSARAFAADPLARAAASRAIAHRFDQSIAVPERMFFYLPFEHSEDPADQERCAALNRASGDGDAIKWAELHADIIRRFGRFPHRNAVLGRTSTPEEQAFLASGGFAG